LIIYLDTSALLKRYIQENSSAELIDLLGGMDLAGTSILTYVEMASALARSGRQGMFPSTEAQAAWRDFLADWESLSRLNISSQLTERAADQAWQHQLRGYDAMHLASALLWQEALSATILLATFDRHLWQAGLKSGLAIWPDHLDD
jgi:predicted nucleic acid-binding protein